MLEAINSGIPVVCSDIKVLKEIIKIKKYMANPYDNKKFSKLLVDILENKKEKNKLVKFNLKNIKEFSEKNYFLKLSKIYRELIN